MAVKKKFPGYVIVIPLIALIAGSCIAFLQSGGAGVFQKNVSLGDTVQADSTDTQPPSQEGSQNPAPASAGEYGGGIYEGEIDRDGVPNGWGIWVYDNCRYEGSFSDGMPNGEGILITTFDPPDVKDPDRTYTIETTQQGYWVDGFADGAVFDIWYMDNGGSHYWNYDVENGIPQSGIIAYCSDCGASLEQSGIIGVPPWSGR